jgi:hypothetical protein
MDARYNGSRFLSVFNSGPTFRPLYVTPGLDGNFANCW